ncbi:MAG: hypothetical protein EA370_18075 [Wenzhouxiangella sp.]|nr:MAG: hypothetical protein EA370_18075 [Wenzhouxiangella sp.]
MVVGYQPRHDPSNSFLQTAITVEQVTGGRDTNPMWTSQVDSTSFRVALERSLDSAGLLASGRLNGYWLSAELLRLDQPMIGASLTVTASVRYRLVDMDTGARIYERVIERPYTAQFSDAFIGTERLKLANEGAIRVNIELLIDDLFALGN